MLRIRQAGPARYLAQAFPDAAANLGLLRYFDLDLEQASERELESMVSQLQATLDSAADGMMVCGLDGSVRAGSRSLTG